MSAPICRASPRWNLILLHQLVRECCGFTRTGTEIETDPVDLAAVDAATIVDHPEIGALGAPYSENGPVYGMMLPILI